MKGDPKVVRVLNQVLRKELTGINQYFVHAKMCDNWGYSVLAKHARNESIDEMRHAEAVIDRILFLDGTPNMVEMDKLLVGKSVREQLESDLALEQAALTVLVPGIGVCNEADDHGSRDLLERIVKDEEEHIGWLEAQLHQIKEMGYENYLTLQVGDLKGGEK